MSPPQNVCGMNFKSVSNHAKAQLVGLNIDTDHFMYIMPDCADFEGAEAWGEMNGTDTWIPSRNGSVALVQVSILVLFTLFLLSKPDVITYHLKYFNSSRHRFMR